MSRRCNPVRRHVAIGALLAAFMVAAAPAVPAMAADGDEALERAFETVRTHAQGEAAQQQAAIRNAVIRAAEAPDARRALERKLLELLDDGTVEAKRFAMRMLQGIAGEASIEPVAGYLLDAGLSHMARFVLEVHPDPAAGRALREALSRLSDGGDIERMPNTTRARLKAGMVGSLGERRDDEALGLIIAVASSSEDADLMRIAAAALARIGGTEAEQALAAISRRAPEALQAELFDARLTCARDLIAQGEDADAWRIFRQLEDEAVTNRQRAAVYAQRLLIAGDEAMAMAMRLAQSPQADIRAAGLRYIRQIASTEALRAAVADLHTLAAPVQVAVIEAIAQRGETALREPVRRAADSDDTAIGHAAIAALGRVGTEAEVPLLIERLERENDREVALGALQRLLPAEAVNDAIVEHLPDAPIATQRRLLGVLVARNATDSPPRLLRHMAAIMERGDAADGELIGHLADALTELGLIEHVPAMLEVLMAAEDEGRRRRIERAIIRTAMRATQPRDAVPMVIAAMTQAQPPARAVMIRLLANLAGPAALEAVIAELDHEQPDIRRAAVRALAHWPDPAALPTLDRLLEDDAHARDHGLLLRGRIRLIGADEHRPLPERVAMLEQAMAATQGPAERRQALSIFGRLHSDEALSAVEPWLDDEQVRDEAAAAALAICRAIAADHREQAMHVLRSIGDVSENQRLRNEAAALLERLEQEGG